MNKNGGNPVLKAVAFDASKLPRTNGTNQAVPKFTNSKSNTVNIPNRPVSNNLNKQTPINLHNNVTKKGPSTNNLGRPNTGNIIFPSDANSGQLAINRMDLKTVQAQRNVAFREIALLKGDLKKQKRNTWKIVVPITLVFAATIAATTPFVVQYANDQDKNAAYWAAFNTIEKTPTSAEWKIFVRDELKSVSNNPSAMQAKIDANSDSWKTWIAPQSINGEINNDAIKAVKSVNVVANARSQYKINFDIEFHGHINFHPDYNNSEGVSENLFELIDVSWKTNATETIQTIVDAGQPYANTDEVREHLRQLNNLETIKDLIVNGDKIESLDYVVSGTNNNYSIQVIHTLSSIYMANTPLPNITNIKTNFNIPIAWNNQVAAKDAIQAIIGNEAYVSLDAISSKLHLTANNNQIKSLLLNGDKIASLQFTITGDNNNYNLTTNFTFNPGYISSDTIPVIEGFKANLLVNTTWNELDLAKSRMETILGTKGYENAAAMKAELEKPANVASIKSNISNASRIDNITFNVIQVAPNNYTVTPSLIMKNGYVSQANPIAITQVRASIAVSLSWTNLNSVDIIMLASIRNSNPDNTGTMEGSLNEEWQTFISLTNDPTKIQSITFKVALIDTLKFRITPIVTMKTGYVQSGVLQARDIVYSYVANNVQWKDYEAAKLEIQNIIGTKAYYGYDGVKNELEKPENITRIKAQINDSHTIESISFRVTFDDIDNYLITSNFVLKPGFALGEPLEPIRNIIVNDMRIPVVWKDPVFARNYIQLMIYDSRLENINELKDHLNQPEAIEHIKSLITNADKIWDLEVQLVQVGSGANATYTFSFKFFLLQLGFNETDPKITPITGLNAYVAPPPTEPPHH